MCLYDSDREIIQFYYAQGIYGMIISGISQVWLRWRAWLVGWIYCMVLVLTRDVIMCVQGCKGCDWNLSWNVSNRTMHQASFMMVALCSVVEWIELRESGVVVCFVAQSPLARLRRKGAQLTWARSGIILGRKLKIWCYMGDLSFDKSISYWETLNSYH